MVLTSTSVSVNAANAVTQVETSTRGTTAAKGRSQFARAHLVSELLLQESLEVQTSWLTLDNNGDYTSPLSTC